MLEAGIGEKAEEQWNSYAPRAKSRSHYQLKLHKIELVAYRDRKK